MEWWWRRFWISMQSTFITKSVSSNFCSDSLLANFTIFAEYKCFGLVDLSYELLATARDGTRSLLSYGAKNKVDFLRSTILNFVCCQYIFLWGFWIYIQSVLHQCCQLELVFCTVIFWIPVSNLLWHASLAPRRYLSLLEIAIWNPLNSEPLHNAVS